MITPQGVPAGLARRAWRDAGLLAAVAAVQLACLVTALVAVSSAELLRPAASEFTICLSRDASDLPAGFRTEAVDVRPSVSAFPLGVRCEFRADGETIVLRPPWGPTVTLVVATAAFLAAGGLMIRGLRRTSD